MEKQFLIDDFKLSESWRIFKILGEFVDGIENLHDLGPAVSIFGSARTLPKDPVYQTAREIAYAFAKSGFSIITGGGGGASSMLAVGSGLERHGHFMSTIMPEGSFPCPPRRQHPCSPLPRFPCQR